MRYKVACSVCVCICVGLFDLISPNWPCCIKNNFWPELNDIRKFTQIMNVSRSRSLHEPATATTWLSLVLGSRNTDWSRCSGKFVAPENFSHTQQYGLKLRLKIELNLGLGLALVTLWQYRGGKNFPGATNFPRHRHSPSDYRTSGTRVRSVGCMRSFCSFVLGCRVRLKT